MSDDGLPPERRWEPRCRRACVFCLRLFWHEELLPVFLAGDGCFMAAPEKVADLLSWEKYHEQWQNCANCGEQ